MMKRVGSITIWVLISITFVLLAITLVNVNVQQVIIGGVR